MHNNQLVFVDANVFIYFLDETAQPHREVIDTLQKLVDNEMDLYTSHHVIEEVLFIVSRLSSGKEKLQQAIDQISNLPRLNLVEPIADFTFAQRYVELYRNSKVGINDTLLLQLMLDAGIKSLLSFDEKLLKQANLLGIERITTV